MTEEVSDNELRQAYEDGYSVGYETGKKNERELQCGLKHLESLKKMVRSLEAENEILRESALIWHKVEHLDTPDEDGNTVWNNPVEYGKEYLLKLKHCYDVDELDYDDDGFFFPAHDWSEIEAWAEVPELTGGKEHEV